VYALSPLGVTGDDLYIQPIVGNQGMIDWLFYTFGLGAEPETWNGEGFDQADNPLMSLGRALTGLYALVYASGNPNYNSPDAPYINRAWKFAWEQLDDVRSTCGSSVATTIGYARLELHQKFYQRSVPERAGTFVHEARHQLGKHVHRDANSHNAKADPSKSLYDPKNPNELSADSSWEYWGAWAMQAAYLGAYFERAVGTTTALRERARQRANIILDNNFTVHPGFTVAPTLPSPCGVAARQPEVLDVFVRSTDAAVYQKSWSGTGPWAPGEGVGEWWYHGGGILGTPVVVAWGPDRLDLVVTGTDNSIYHKAWDSGTWYPGEGPDDWEHLGGGVIGPPAVVSWGPNRLDILVTGTDGAVYHKAWAGGPDWYPGNGLEDWNRIGGQIFGTPAATTWGADRLDIVVAGLDGAVYHKAWDTDTWYPGPGHDEWDRLGGTVIASPTAISWGPDRLDIFGVGTDNGVYHKWWGDSDWRPDPLNPDVWEALGSPDASGVFSTPTVVSWGLGRLDVFVVGSDTSMYHKAFEGGTWYPDGQDNWERLGGNFAGAPAAVCWGPDRIDIFASGIDAQLWHKFWDGSNWGPDPTIPNGWEEIGGKIG
jgi:hypothetical protein